MWVACAGSYSEFKVPYCGMCSWRLVSINFFQHNNYTELSGCASRTSYYSNSHIYFIGCKCFTSVRVSESVCVRESERVRAGV